MKGLSTDNAEDWHALVVSYQTIQYLLYLLGLGLAQEGVIEQPHNGNAKDYAEEID